MREKTLQLVVTFHTTADAMYMEKICKINNINGRLIPVPRDISAGCGLAFKSPLTERDALRNVMEKEGIENEDIYEIMLY